MVVASENATAESPERSVRSRALVGVHTRRFFTMNASPTNTLTSFLGPPDKPQAPEPNPPMISPEPDNSGQIRTASPSPTAVVAESSAGTQLAPERYRQSDETLLIEIAKGAPLCRAAERAGVCERTARRRWADPAFRQKILDLRCEMRWQAAGQLSAEMGRASNALSQALDAESASVRVSAARAILRIGDELGSRAEENALLVATLEKLKQEMALASGRGLE
jgi:hypothetical protein